METFQRAVGYGVTVQVLPASPYLFLDYESGDRGFRSVLPPGP
jgi:hypothetical protein